MATVLLISPGSSADSRRRGGGCTMPLEFNKKSTAVVSLLRKCLAAFQHGNISALIDLCGESETLLLVNSTWRSTRCTTLPATPVTLPLSSL